MAEAERLIARAAILRAEAYELEAEEPSFVDRIDAALRADRGIAGCARPPPCCTATTAP